MYVHMFVAVPSGHTVVVLASAAAQTEIKINTILSKMLFYKQQLETNHHKCLQSRQETG